MISIAAREAWMEQRMERSGKPHEEIGAMPKQMAHVEASVIAPAQLGTMHLQCVVMLTEPI